MSLTSRLINHNSVIQFLDSADGKIFIEYFQLMRDKSVNQIRKASELRDIFYAQGSADVADAICNLKRDILQYLDDVRTGKIKPEGVKK